MPLLLLGLRPLSALVSVVGEGLSAPRAAMLGWFGIRGIGSLFYFLFALRQGLDPHLADTLLTL